VKSPSGIDSLQKKIILKSQSTVPLTAITPCEESVIEGDDLMANLGLGETTVSPSPIRNPKITQAVSKTNSDTEFIRYAEYGNLRE
jgi:hypothetical protein